VSHVGTSPIVLPLPIHSTGSREGGPLLVLPPPKHSHEHGLPSDPVDTIGLQLAVDSNETVKLTFNGWIILIIFLENSNL